MSVGGGSIGVGGVAGLGGGRNCSSSSNLHRKHGIYRVREHALGASSAPPVSGGPGQVRCAPGCLYCPDGATALNIVILGIHIAN